MQIDIEDRRRQTHRVSGCYPYLCSGQKIERRVEYLVSLHGTQTRLVLLGGDGYA